MIQNIFLLVVLFFGGFILTRGQDILTPSSQPMPFRKDYVYESTTQMFYKVHKIPLSFQDAVNLCKFEGTQLAVPKTEREAMVLSSMFRPGVDSVWVALHDIYAEGNFMTLDGTSIDDVYSKWWPGEPNNVNNDEDCVVMSQSQMYNDGHCGSKINFICSIPESSVEYDVLCETNHKDYFYNIERDCCYKMHTTPRTWHDAFKICKAEEASLLVVTSTSEAKFITDIFNTRYPDASLKGNFERNQLFLDFTDLVTPGEFITSDGKTLSCVGFDTFENGQPDNYNGVEHCGTIFRSGKLNDLNCGHKTMFMCKKILGAPEPISLFKRTGYTGQTQHR